MPGSQAAHAGTIASRGSTRLAERVGSLLIPVSVFGGFAAAGQALLGTLPTALVACTQIGWHRRRARLERHHGDRVQAPARAVARAAVADPRPLRGRAVTIDAAAPESALPGPEPGLPRQRCDDDWAQRDPHEPPALTLRRMLEQHDPITGAHLARLPEYTRILVRRVAQHPRYRRTLSADLLAMLPEASTLHDVGKLGVPRSLLLKAGRLTTEEFTIMKRHTISGGRTLRELAQRCPGDLLLALGEQIAMYHHERWDGSGYPFGLGGMQIPLAARVVAVADVYDALTSVRPYKPAYSHEQSRRFIVSQAGTHFDPDVVEAFVRCEKHFPNVRENVTAGATDAGTRIPGSDQACTNSM
jgi:HD-GYP domain-containing protein (c-di-GMP phosphodiesterase class II)